MKLIKTAIFLAALPVTSAVTEQLYIDATRVWKAVYYLIQNSWYVGLQIMNSNSWYNDFFSPRDGM